MLLVAQMTAEEDKILMGGYFYGSTEPSTCMHNSSFTFCSNIYFFEFLIFLIIATT